MKKYIINKFVVGALLLTATSCTDKYFDINSNPYQPGDLNPDDYALGSAMSNLASTVISSDVNTANSQIVYWEVRWEDTLPILIQDGLTQSLIIMQRMTGPVYL